jgi:hypothetical protein
MVANSKGVISESV